MSAFRSLRAEVRDRGTSFKDETDEIDETDARDDYTTFNATITP